MYKDAPLGTGGAAKARKALKGRRAQIETALGNDLNGGPTVYKGKGSGKYPWQK